MNHNCDYGSDTMSNSYEENQKEIERCAEQRRRNEGGRRREKGFICK